MMECAVRTACTTNFFRRERAATGEIPRESKIERAGLKMIPEKPRIKICMAQGQINVRSNLQREEIDIIQHVVNAFL